jgi:hypothetical protein
MQAFWWNCNFYLFLQMLLYIYKRYSRFTLCRNKKSWHW